MGESIIGKIQCSQEIQQNNHSFRVIYKLERVNRNKSNFSYIKDKNEKKLTALYIKLIKESSWLNGISSRKYFLNENQ